MGDDCSWDYNVALWQCFCVRGGIHWRGSGVNLRDHGNVNVGNQGLRKPLESLSAMEVAVSTVSIRLLFGFQYRGPVLFLEGNIAGEQFLCLLEFLFVCFLPKELKAIKQGQQFFLHNLIWPVKIYSSKLY